MHRRNRTDWLVTVRLADLVRLAEVVTRARRPLDGNEEVGGG
jgi:hypothetical protein